MTKLLEKAIAEVLELPEETQNMAADALFMVIEHANDDDHYRLTQEQVVGVHHAMGQADRGEFATNAEGKEIFGRSLCGCASRMTPRPTFGRSRRSSANGMQSRQRA
jgi:hypothetical protein